ncbi:MAG TPA: type II toxin-antitoxin system VapC family toxin [Rhabdochlamydiaceae bacterium]|nr:type II toxin-antitoxin system VapC family toxin [Rhabdochlamydiaceae bacterium]
MKLLLDTHIFLWWVRDDKRLSKTITNKIKEADEVYISSASIWEIAIKMRLEKISGDMNALIQEIHNSHFLELLITSQHAAATLELPDIHRDPFDRILIAQAISEPLVFLTADSKLKKYSELVEVIP